LIERGYAADQYRIGHDEDLAQAVGELPGIRTLR
jgi:hypothetical protein